MKRNSPQFNSVNGEEVKTRLKHQNLLEEYLELQKEFVSNKKKLKIANQKQEDLLVEVGFLRQRYSYLSMMRSQVSEQEDDSVRLQNQCLQSKSGINEVEKSSCSLPNLDPNAVHEDKDGRSQIHVQSLLWNENKIKYHLSNSTKFGKKKISWEDQMALKV